MVATTCCLLAWKILLHWDNVPKRGGSAEASLHQLGAVRGERQKDG